MTVPRGGHGKDEDWAAEAHLTERLVWLQPVGGGRAGGGGQGLRTEMDHTGFKGHERRDCGWMLSEPRSLQRS